MLEIDGLTRRFGDRTAVDDVTFDVPDGALTGFVGGNGAGKTTTMRMIMGLLAIHGGQVRMNGRPVTAADRSRFGYMPEERGLYPKQKVLDQLVFLGRLHGMSASAARTQAAGLLDRFGLGDRAKDPLEKLSLGNQQRVQIIAAVLGDPDVLILDEPFSGLDPQSVDTMADLLREHTRRGVPVLFSSHQLDLVDRLCDGLVVLAAGRVVARGTSDELRHRGVVRHRLVGVADAGWVREVPGVHVIDVDGRTALVEVTGDDVLAALAAQAVARGGLLELHPLVPTIGEIYREITA